VYYTQRKGNSGRQETWDGQRSSNHAVGFHRDGVGKRGRLRFQYFHSQCRGQCKLVQSQGGLKGGISAKRLLHRALSGTRETASAIGLCSQHLTGIFGALQLSCSSSTNLLDSHQLQSLSREQLTRSNLTAIDMSKERKRFAIHCFLWQH
jgi:hypothetical protein